MILTYFLILCLLGLAYSNGANDNPKAVATLIASRTASYRGALWLTTISTLLGSLAALVAAKELIGLFTGRGLVPQQVALDPTFLAAVGLGAGVTVFIATRLGMPISTTHSLLGALVGAGLATGGGIVLSVLANKFLLPLLAAPIMAATLTGLAYRLVGRRNRGSAGSADVCLCVDAVAAPTLLSPYPAGQALAFGDSAPGPPRQRMIIATSDECATTSSKVLLRTDWHFAVDALHYLSGSAVAFGRGLNDTPKIVALSIGFTPLATSQAIVLVAVAMAAGGLISSRKVAATMSEKVSHMDRGEGLITNLVTSFLTIFASRWGLPVSTTHVSVGSIVGIGTANRTAIWPTVTRIFGAWVVTLPTAAVFSAVAFLMLR